MFLLGNIDNPLLDHKDGPRNPNIVIVKTTNYGRTGYPSPHCRKDSQTTMELFRGRFVVSIQEVFVDYLIEFRCSGSKYTWKRPGVRSTNCTIYGIIFSTI